MAPVAPVARRRLLPVSAPEIDVVVPIYNEAAGLHGLTSGALGVLHALDAAPARPLELAILVLASTAATVTRYVALRTWVFARGRRAPVAPVAVLRERCNLTP